MTHKDIAIFGALGWVLALGSAIVGYLIVREGVMAAIQRTARAERQHVDEALVLRRGIKLICLGAPFLIGGLFVCVMIALGR